MVSATLSQGELQFLNNNKCLESWLQVKKKKNKKSQYVKFILLRRERINANDLILIGS